MLNHVTYHVAPGTLDRLDFNSFIMALGFEEVPAEESVPNGWKVRWFEPSGGGPIRPIYPLTKLHLIEGDWKDEGDRDLLALGHMCVSGVGSERYQGLMATSWCVRNSGSGRIWLEFANLRVEVRP